MLSPYPRASAFCFRFLPVRQSSDHSAWFLTLQLVREDCVGVANNCTTGRHQSSGCFGFCCPPDTSGWLFSNKTLDSLSQTCLKKTAQAQNRTQLSSQVAILHTRFRLVLKKTNLLVSASLRFLVKLLSVQCRRSKPDIRGAIWK